MAEHYETIQAVGYKSDKWHEEIVEPCTDVIVSARLRTGQFWSLTQERRRPKKSAAAPRGIAGEVI